MEHSNFSAPIWFTEFSPQEQQGKPIETGIILLIMDIKNELFLCIFHRHAAKSKNLGEQVVMRRAAAAWRRLLTDPPKSGGAAAPLPLPFRHACFKAYKIYERFW